MRTIAIIFLAIALFGCDEDYLYAIEPIKAGADAGTPSWRADAGFTQRKAITTIRVPVSGARTQSLHIRVVTTAHAETSAPEHTVRSWIGTASTRND